MTSTTKRGLRLLGSIAGPHGLDRYLEQIKPTLVLEECRAEVLAAERGAESVTLTLRPNRAWRGFRAGQFVELTVEIDGVRHTRCYSPASAEGRERRLEITVKRHPEGLVSNHLVDRAAPGMVVGLSDGGAGDFALPDRRPGPILLIAGGSGITPLMAMLRSLAAERHPGPVALIQYAPDPERAIYREELEAVAAELPGLRVSRSYTRAPGAGELDGHFCPAHLESAAPGFAAAETYACGPPALLAALREAWQGETERRLHTESFVPPPLIPPGEAGEGSIRFEDSGLEVENSGASLLEQAEGAGLSPEFGCRMGICRSCSCRKRSGPVKNLLTGEVSARPDEEIQLCISAPLGDLVLEI